MLVINKVGVIIYQTRKVTIECKACDVIAPISRNTMLSNNGN